MGTKKKNSNYMRNVGCCNRFSPAIVVSFFFQIYVFKLCLPVFAEYTCIWMAFADNVPKK